MEHHNKNHKKPHFSASPPFLLILSHSSSNCPGLLPPFDRAPSIDIWIPDRHSQPVHYYAEPSEIWRMYLHWFSNVWPTLRSKLTFWSQVAGSNTFQEARWSTPPRGSCPPSEVSPQSPFHSPNMPSRPNDVGTQPQIAITARADLPWQGGVYVVWGEGTYHLVVPDNVLNTSTKGSRENDAPGQRQGFFRMRRGQCWEWAHLP